MFAFGLYVLMMTGIAFALFSLWKRVPAGFRAWLLVAVRDVRRSFGSYDVKELIDAMEGAALASAIPSIRTSYLPSRIEYGIHSRDFARWGGYVEMMELELVNILTDRCQTDPRYTLPDGGVEIWIVESEGAKPGKPIFRILALDAQPTQSITDDHEVVEIPVRRSVGADRSVATPTVVADEISTVTRKPRLSDTRDFVVHKFELDNGKVIEIPAESIIGRGRDVDVKFDQEDVSREHARFTLLDDIPVIVDLNSENGTFVNDEMVRTWFLTEGEVVCFGGGSACLTYRGATRA